MFVASLAIAGIPGLAGFFSKDEILWQVYSSPLGSKALYVVGLVTAAHDRVLHVAADVHDLLRHVARGARMRPRTSTSRRAR